MQTTRDPMPGELKLAVLVGRIQFHAFQPVAALDPLMDAVERRFRDGSSLRHDRIGQMSIRQWVSSELRGDVKAAQARFDDLCGATCIWLALRHYEAAAHMMDAVHRHAEGGVVLTVSIGDNPSSAEGTAWSFMLGHDVHDGRALLADQPSDRLLLYGSDVPEGWRECAFYPKT